jgi:7-cyano-7-deazaguanine synthase in queuosine biosynthesis
MRKTIMPFSGGLDSTYALWKTLRETDDAVTVVTITGQHHDTRKPLRASAGLLSPHGWEKAKQVADAVAAATRAFSFEVKEVNADLDTNQFVPGVGQVSLRMATDRVNSGEFDCVAATYEMDNDGTLWGGTKSFQFLTSAMVAHENFKRYATRGRIEFPLIEMGYTQAVALRDLPPSLYALAFSCDRGVVEGAACGRCYKCCKRKFFKILLDGGQTVDDIRNLWRDRSTTPDGWVPMKLWLGEYIPEYLSWWDPDTPPYPMPSYPQAYEVT